MRTSTDLRGQFQWPDTPTSTTRDFHQLERDWDAVLAHFAEQPEPENSQNPDAKLSAYEWLERNPQTSEFAKLLDRAPLVRKGVQGDLPNCTVWAPTNDAWRDFHYDDDAQFEMVLQHHVAAHDMPLTRLLETACIPTLARPSTLNGPLSQRRRIAEDHIAIHGQSRMVRMTAQGIRVSNGTVYLVDGILHLPPPISQLSSVLPDTQFSHLLRFLAQTDFAEELSLAFKLGGTFFAPIDEAFEALGADVLAFLESSEGTLYLRNLLRYHATAGETLYSSMFYHGENKDGVTSPPIKREPQIAAIGHNVKPQAPMTAGEPGTKSSEEKQPGSRAQKPAASAGSKVIKGRREFPLPTLLGQQWCQAEIVRVGGVISMSVQAEYGEVVTQDVMTLNGVVHAINRVMIPPLEDLQGLTSKGDLERLKMALDPRDI